MPVRNPPLPTKKQVRLPEEFFLRDPRPDAVPERVRSMFRIGLFWVAFTGLSVGIATGAIPLGELLRGALAEPVAEPENPDGIEIAAAQPPAPVSSARSPGPPRIRWGNTALPRREEPAGVAVAAAAPELAPPGSPTAPGTAPIPGLEPARPGSGTAPELGTAAASEPFAVALRPPGGEPGPPGLAPAPTPAEPTEPGPVAARAAPTPEPAVVSPPAPVEPAPPRAEGPVSAHAGASCAAAASRANQVIAPGKKPPPDLPRSAFSSVLNNGRWFAHCPIPSEVSVGICVAVQNGRVVGATATTSPGTPAMSRCVAQAAQRLRFQSHPALDVARTTFAGQ